MAVKVGSFTKSTNTSVPVSQAITGVGFKPRALILWTVCATSADTTGDGFRFAMGFAARNAADTITQGSVAGAAQDDVADENSSERIAAKALTIVEWGESLLAECGLASFDAGGFTLSWTANNDQAYIINYMALGGPSMTDAAVVEFTVPASTGDAAVTGAGFVPDAVLHLLGNCTSVPTTQASAYISLGGMTTADQFSHRWMVQDANASGKGVSGGILTACISQYTSSTTVDLLAAYASMDADGYTVNYSNGGGGEKGYSLCLKGGSYDIGGMTIQGIAAGDDIAVTGVGFQPEGVLFSDYDGSDLRVMVGATDGTEDRAVAIADDYLAATINTAHRSASNRSGVLISDTDGSVYLDYFLKTLGADGFTVTVPTYPGTQPVSYFAFSGGAAAGGSALLMQHHHHSTFRGGSL